MITIITIIGLTIITIIGLTNKIFTNARTEHTMDITKAYCIKTLSLLYISYTILIMATPLRLFAWNVRGIMSSALCLSKTLELLNADVAVISEHKLSVANSLFLDTLHGSYTAFPQNQEDSVATSNCVSLMVKRSLLFSVTYLPECEQDRIVGIKLSTSNTTPLYIFGVYLPYDQDIEAYARYISSLWDIWNLYNDQGEVIILGDFNARYAETPLSHVQRVKTRLLTKFIQSNNIVPLNKSNKCSGLDYTYTTNCSTIDFILTNETLYNNVEHCEVISSNDIDVASDHLLVFCTLSLPVKHFFEENNFSLPAWHKATCDMLISYQFDVHTELSKLVNLKPASATDVDQYCQVVTEALQTCAVRNIPHSKFKSFTKPYWNANVKAAHSNATQKRRLWIHDGKPRGMQHASYAEYKRAKSNFRNIQQAAIFEFDNKQLNEIDKCADHDIRLFWRLLNSKKGRKKNNCNELHFNGNKSKTPQDIASMFACYFSDLYSYNDDPDTPSVDLIYNSKEPSHTISAEDIIKQLKTLKKRKAPGIDKVQNEHIIYGGRTLIQCLSNLYSAMLTYKHIPSAWKTGIIIPIYKGGAKSKVDPNSYRAISLLPSMYKLFEKVIHENILSDVHFKHPEFPSKQQQGYQKQMGSSTVAFNIHESIYNTVETGEKAFVAFLDIHKAFDTVWHSGLFRKLKCLNISPTYLDIIVHAYKNIKGVVSINGCQSTPFSIQQGIRQGGVLSSFLYLVFINDLIEELDTSGLGVSICDVPTNNPTLVDDISLISRYPLHLQLMINIVVDYADMWKFNINSSKSSVMIISTNRRAMDTNYIWTVKSETLTVAQCSTHVGIPISNNMKCRSKVENASRKGRAALHRLVGLDLSSDSPKLNPLTLTKLYKSIVIPSALYGCETWSQMTTSDILEIDKLQHYYVKKIQYLPNQTRSYMCESLLGLPKLSYEIDKRKLYFLQKLIVMPESTITKQIFLRRLFTYLQDITDRTPLGFIPDIMVILQKYNLMNYIHEYSLNHTFPNTSAWKKIVKNTLFRFETTNFKQTLQTDDDFVRFKEVHDIIRPSILWQTVTTTAELKLMHFIIKCLVLIPKQEIQICPKCDRDYQDPLKHIVMSCTATVNIRTSLWDYIVDTLSPNCSVTLCSLDNEEFLHVLLGKRLAVLEDEFPEQKDYFTFVKCCAKFINCAVTFYYSASLSNV